MPEVSDHGGTPDDPNPIEAAIGNALRSCRSQFTGLSKELWTLFRACQEASEQLVRPLTCFKEFKERAKAAYLKATGAVKPVETPVITMST